jgi:hypothetical protein
MRPKTLAGLAVAAGAGVFMAGSALAEIHADVYARQATIIQVLKAFDNPEGAIFSADGAYVFISNSAEIGDRGPSFGWAEGEGYVSKLEVQPNGELKMINDKLVTGLTAPLGMGVLPVATGKFPAGTIFLCSGSAQVDSNGQPVKDRSRLRTKLVAFNENGQRLGEIDTGANSLFEEINGTPIALMNALSFDAEGNLYVTDTAFGGEQFEPPFENKGGVWMIPVAALDDLAAGKRPAGDQMPRFIPVPGNPDGIEVSPKDGRIYVNTVGPVGPAPDPANGGIYALTKADFSGEAAQGKLPPPVDGNLGALDGLDFTAGGVILNTQIRDDKPQVVMVSCPGKIAATLALEPGGSIGDLNGPADLAVRRSADGPQLVVIPELFARAPNHRTDEVTVLALPAGFDAVCGG